MISIEALPPSATSALVMFVNPKETTMACPLGVVSLTETTTFSFELSYAAEVNCEALLNKSIGLSNVKDVPETVAAISLPFELVVS